MRSVSARSMHRRKRFILMPTLTETVRNHQLPCGLDTSCWANPCFQPQSHWASTGKEQMAGRAALEGDLGDKGQKWRGSQILLMLLLVE